MVKELSPNSLISLVPQSVGSITQYSLSGSQSNRIPHCRTELYKKYFLPAVIEEWNDLPIEIRNEDSLSCFQCYLNRDKPSPNKLYFIGERKLQVIQIRNKCSSLNNHLLLKNIVDPLSVLVVGLRRVNISFLNVIIMMLSGLVYLMQYQYLVTLILKCYSLGKVIFYTVIMRNFFLKSKNLLS